jgi:flagellar M-ring protein FliF
LASIVQNFGEVWQHLSVTRKVMLLGLLLACVGAAVMVANWARKPKMGLLYSQLDPSEAAKIVEKISESGTPYELADGGTTIRVPQGSQAKLRLTLASQGLPSDSQGGYKILDEEKIGASPFAQQINYTRAIEGELAKSIQLIQGVSRARLHIVRPEKTVFARNEQQASATVMLQLKGGWRFSPSSVAAVTHMVAGAVPGLTSDKVVVIDSGGNLLAGDDANGEFARGATTFLDYKSRVEQYLSNKAEQMLTAVLGPNRASVQVSVVLETSSTNQTRETYSPDGRVASKEKETTSTMTPPAAGEGQAAGGSSKQTTAENSYLVSKTVEQRVDLAGTIKSISVAAFVDLGSGEEGKTTITQKDAEEIIRNAVGMSANDAPPKVVQTTFHQPEAQELVQADQGMFNKDFILEIAKRSSLGILVLGVLVMLKLFGSSKSKTQTPALTGAAQGALGGQTTGGDHLLPGAEADADVVRARITRALQDNPEEVKRLFLNWVQSEKGEV